MPQDLELDQDEEWIAVRNGNGWQTLRLHDYDVIYRTPGLYEAIVYDVLGCRSPNRLVQLFDHVLANWPTEPGDLRVLDLGAGNGIVGERLRKLGVERLVGIDILPEAATAAQRDRPGTYDDYVVADLCDPTPENLDRIQREQPNALFTVAALGFGDIPPDAFRTAFNAIETPGWLALTIKEDFLESGEESGFSGLLRRMVRHGIVNEEARLRIRHRTSIAGEPIFYVAIIARKLEDIPARLVN
jgi:SAM-dependent methyltransferase